jgi:CHAT domain-containing protein
MRGERLLILGREEKRAWRELHQVLIQPIRNWLPAKPGATLTIVPHGPLFLLSFAALLDETGRYLVERYTLHYTPSVAALQLSERKKLGLTGRSPEYLLIADPAGLPSQPNGKPLPSLPGSRKEVSAIAQLLHSRGVTTLVGAEAQEERIRDVSSDKTIIHIATHGVVRNDSPLDSFLALGRGPSTDSQAAADSRDGRLTVQEIYDLRLRSDLVVLSACRTASGRISGDGLIGLTRAFFYAGTPSVIATLWDVADEPTHLLLPAFYRNLNRFQDKGKALRAAQLQLLSALRGGQMKIATATDTYILPEHPAFWASFILLGEP